MNIYEIQREYTYNWFAFLFEGRRNLLQQVPDRENKISQDLTCVILKQIL